MKNESIWKRGKGNVTFMALIVLLLSITFTFIIAADELLPGEDPGAAYLDLQEIAMNEGQVRVIVKLDVAGIKELTAASTRFQTTAPGRAEVWGGNRADAELQEAISFVTDSVLYSLGKSRYQINHTYISLPYLALAVSPEALEILRALPEVLDIQQDVPMRLPDPIDDTNQEPKGGLAVASSPDQPMLNNTVNVIGANNAWTMGYTGSGWYVAVLDTGIRKTHQFFTGKTVVEACYALGEDGAGPAGDCPNGNTSMIGAGAAVHYASTYSGYDHGTHVSGIATGNYGSLHGVARSANIIAVKVFSRFSTSYCGSTPCVMSWNSDCTAGLDYVYSIRGSYSIAAVNMSLGGGAYSSACDSDVRKTVIDNLRNAGIATAIATGNDGYCGSVGAPACISSSIAVGASTDADLESSFNNWHATMQKVFAPGSSVYSSTGSSDSSYGSWDGTSMATPHVAGACALLKQAKPTGTVTAILSALRTTGQGITSVCDAYTVPIPRIQVDKAITNLAGKITVTSPAAGQTFPRGYNLSIGWTTQSMLGTVNIYLKKVDLTSSYTVKTGAAYNASPYTYTIPGTVAPGYYFIRVKQDTKYGDSGKFYIGTITVTSPTVGSTYHPSDPITVAWTSAGIVGTVKILLNKTDGTYSYTFDAVALYNSSPRGFTIPAAAPAGTYTVKVIKGKVTGKSANFIIN